MPRRFAAAFSFLLALFCTLSLFAQGQEPAAGGLADGPTEVPVRTADEPMVEAQSEQIAEPAAEPVDAAIEVNAEERDVSEIDVSEVGGDARKMGWEEIDGREIILTPGDPAPNTEESGGLLQLSLWTGFIITAIVGGLWLIRRYFPKAGLIFGNDAIRILTRKSLSTRHTLLLVESGDRILLIGMTRENMQVLSDFDDPTVKALIRSKCPTPGNVAHDEQKFRQELQREVEVQTAAGGEETPSDATNMDSILDQIQDIKQTMSSWKV